MKKILNKKEAMDYLGLNRFVFDAEVNKGKIPFIIAGKLKKFPVWVLDRWLNDTTNHTDCSKEATPTTPTSLLCAKQESEYSLERLVIQAMKQKLTNTALNAYHKSKAKPDKKSQVNYLA
jgi:hypothetical protein